MEEQNKVVQEYDVRKNKVEKLLEQGIHPYNNKLKKEVWAKDIVARFDELSSDESIEVEFIGRVVAKREHGKSAFMHMKDETGKIQVYIKKNMVTEEEFELLKMVDIADFIYIKGPVFKTRTGEITVVIKSMKMVSKAIRSLPEKFHGIQDVEIKYRRRYLDLIMDDEAAARFRTRSHIISFIRSYLDNKEFIEVETPILQPLYGGASARPFISHHNALDMDLYLRIAPELYLKRLIVGGFEKIYEINKNFRNEGIDVRHNPEFTMMELYWAYTTYEEMMELVETLITKIVTDVLKTDTIPYQGEEIDFSKPWKRMKLFDAIKEYSGLDLEPMEDLDELRKVARGIGCDIADFMGRGKIIDEVLKATVIPKLIQPTFLYDYPIELSPLARKRDDNPKIVERFQPFIGGLEVGNAFSELNDPADQKERFMKQVEEKERGDDEAHTFDEDFIRALEHGMPPTSGLGIGIDRLVMLLTDSYSIRDILLFPQMKKETT